MALLMTFVPPAASGAEATGKTDSSIALDTLPVENDKTEPELLVPAGSEG
jgi:hypothetical protein